MGCWQGRGLRSFHPKGQMSLERGQYDLLKEDPSWVLLPLIQLRHISSWAHHYRILTNSLLLSSCPLLRNEAGKGKGSSGSWEQMVRVGSATTLSKCLSALVVRSSGNRDCKVSSVSLREEYPVQNEQLAKHRQLARHLILITQAPLSSL